LFEVRLFPAAARFLEQLGPTDQTDVMRILDLIAVDPYFDGRNKFPYPLEDSPMVLYDSPLFWLVYNIDEGTSEVRILAIGHSRTSNEAL
jgi:mRNA-degrading endonuclease RelE of RelBE toxin-antitoxin system